MSTKRNKPAIPASSIQTKPVGFMGMPVSNNVAGAKAVILGLPFECESDPLRIGAKQGPTSIRQQSHLISPFDAITNINPVTHLKMCDLGDVDVITGDILKSNQAIQQAISSIINDNAIPICLGGDGSIALPQMRALATKHSDLVVLHFDAHTDAYPLDELSNATPFTHAAKEQLISTKHSFHIGRRGSHFVPHVISYCQSLGYNLIDMQTLIEKGVANLTAEVKATIGDRPVYICFDMDFFDPSVAPVVCSPTWGGASSIEGLELIRACKGLNIVACDVNTISPPHDSQGMSALLAATMVYEMMLLICK